MYVGDLGLIPGLEREWQPSILALRIPWIEEPDRLQSMGSQRVGHNGVTNTYNRKQYEVCSKKSIIALLSSNLISGYISKGSENRMSKIYLPSHIFYALFTITKT